MFSTRIFRPGRHPRHHLVDVVAVDLHEFPVLERLERFRRVTREIAQHAHDEGQVFHDHGPFRLHFVSNVYPRGPHAFQLFVDTLRHCFVLSNLMGKKGLWFFPFRQADPHQFKRLGGDGLGRKQFVQQLRQGHFPPADCLFQQIRNR